MAHCIARLKYAITLRSSPPPPKSQASLTRLLNAVLGFTVPGLPKSLVRPWHRHCDVFDVSSKRFLAFQACTYREFFDLSVSINLNFTVKSYLLCQNFFLGWYWSSKNVQNGSYFPFLYYLDCSVIHKRHLVDNWNAIPWICKFRQTLANPRSQPTCYNCFVMITGWTWL